MRRAKRTAEFRSLAVAALMALVAGGCTWTIVASTTSANQVVTGVGGSEIALSATGRYAAFIANDLLGDDVDHREVYVKDLVTGAVQRVSTSSAGVADAGNLAGPSMSDDGRYVAWESDGANVVPGDTNLATDVFVKDRQTGQTTRVSTASNGAQANGFSAENGALSISGNGRFVAFVSDATNLMAGDTNQVPDVFVKNLQTGATSLVSPGGAGSSGEPSISSDGRYVSLWQNYPTGVSIYDRTTGVLTRVANTSELTSPRALSADGRYLAFDSNSSQHVPGDTNGTWDVFVADRVTSAIERVSVSSTGVQGNGVSGRGYERSMAISGDGRYVIFLSAATNLVPNDTNGELDAFVHDRLTHRTARVNGMTGTQINATASEGLAISRDGRYVGIHTIGDVMSNHLGIGPQAYVQANPLPTVTSVLPSTIARGTTKTVTITGSGFVTTPLPIVFSSLSGDGVTYTVQTATDTSIVVAVTAAPSAPVGARTIAVLDTGTGPGVAAGGLTACGACLTVT